MPTPPSFQSHSPGHQLIPSKPCLFSPSPVTTPSSPSNGDPKLKFLPHTLTVVTSKEYDLLVEENEEALRKNVSLQQKLDEALEMQEVTSKRLAEVELQLNAALQEVDTLLAIMKKKGESLIQHSIRGHY